MHSSAQGGRRRCTLCLRNASHAAHRPGCKATVWPGCQNRIVQGHAPPPAADEVVLHLGHDSWWRLGLAIAGVATLAAGGVAVYATSNGTGSAALVAAGVVCLLLGVMWDRVKTVKGAGVEVELLQVAQQKLVAANAADLRGDDSEAARLRAEAQQLLTVVRPWATDYERWRENLPSGPQRTELMDQAVNRAMETAAASRDSGHPIAPEAVRAVFVSGGDGARVTALGLMRGDPSTADLDIVLDVIAQSRSAAEQAYALAVAAEMAQRPDLDDRTAKRLVEAAGQALATEHVRKSHSRRAYAESIVRSLRP